MKPLYVILPFISFWVILLLGCYIYFRDIKNRTNGVFFILCLSLSLYAFAEFMYRPADNLREAELWIKLAGIWMFAPPLFLNLALLFTEKNALLRNKFFYALMYGPALVIYLLGTFSSVYIGTPVQKYWGYTYTAAANPVPFFVGSGISIFWALCAFALILHYSLTTNNELKKKQARYIYAGIAVLIVSSAFTEVLPRLLGYEIPEMNTTIITVFVVILALGSYRYRLFVLEPSAVSDKILSTLSEAVFLLEPGSRIVSGNAAAFVLTSARKQQMLDKPIGLFFREPGIPEWILGPYGEGGTSRETKISANDGVTIPVRLYRSEITDDSGRRYGIVLSCRDITHFREVRHRLQDSVKRLAESNRDLEMFVYNISHDLRGPLNKINAYAGLLESRHKQGLCPEAGEYIEGLYKEALNMNEMIMGLMEYARIKSADFKEAKADLNEVVKEAMQSLKENIDTAGASVMAAGLPVVKGDRAQLALVFKNLLDNALKNSGGKTPVITIDSARKGAEWLVSVSDNGMGIKPEDRERIFDIFQKTMSAEELPGAGIGLAVCKSIVERHGGRIWVEPAAGGGAVFRFTLQAAQNTP